MIPARIQQRADYAHIGMVLAERRRRDVETPGWRYDLLRARRECRA